MVLIKTATVSQSIRKYIYKIQISFFFFPWRKKSQTQSSTKLNQDYSKYKVKYFSKMHVCQSGMWFLLIV